MRISQLEIQTDLRNIGLKEGDIVLLHSSLSSLGEVIGGADALVDAFLGVLGEAGTLVVPTFGALGVVPETVKARSEARHSLHPRAGVAAIGGSAESICRDHWKAETAHGPDTPYTRVAEMGGYVCLLGVDQDRSTTLHAVEEILRLPYLRPTKEYSFETPAGPVTKSWAYFPGPHRDFIGLDRLLRETGRMRIGCVGGAVVRLIAASDLIAIVRAEGDRNPAFALCDNPACADCVRQRADLSRTRFASLTFLVAVSSSLAGHYVDEIAENAHASGLSALELDRLQGKPLAMLGVDVVGKGLERLREAGCRIVSLRASAAGEQAWDLFQLARDAKVSRVVLPFSERSLGHAVMARETGVGVSFCNQGLDSEIASGLLLRLRTEGLPAGFTFNAAEFARAGELPFLGSYKKKLRRFVDQLDLEDALYDGSPRPLGQGNAEIKEMISILAAASFSGAMVLGPSNRSVGNLRDAVQRLEYLLDTM